ncbi:hypothetical protein CCR75_004718 [Bremia lactucae]|uniref:Thioredoxin domain-containing protein n=1 Tax=Bremia lactucae TaxID=4779 RepID=A0A976IKJ3_BRELC|nr:hypothetical protein CCR75_004718 [Bremia lactucae]
MEVSRYRPRRRRYGVSRRKLTSIWTLLGGAFFIVYLLFLLYWRFGNFATLDASMTFNNLRKSRHSIQIHPDDLLLDDTNTIQRQRKEHTHQLPIKAVIATSSPPILPVAITSVPIKSLRVSKNFIHSSTLEKNATLSVQEAERITNTSKNQANFQPQAAPIQSLSNPITAIPATFTRREQFSSLRNETISGYTATLEFLNAYQFNASESLYLFFVCSDALFQAHDWSEECRQSKKHVYNIFSHSSRRNRLVTIYAGSEKYWTHQNAFYNNFNLKIKSVPSILKWEGQKNRTSGMLVQTSLYDEPFLSYLFQTTDERKLLFPANAIQHKQLITIRGYDAYVDTMTQFENENHPVPTFVLMVSGRFPNNKRPWCPYCRYSELPVEFAFFSYAPKNARIYRVEVTDSYTEWMDRTEFTNDPNLQLKIVPLMYKIDQVPPTTSNGSTSIHFSAHKFRYDRLAPLRDFFSSYT